MLAKIHYNKHTQKGELFLLQQFYSPRAAHRCLRHVTFTFCYFSGFSPLQCAVFCSHSEIVSTLLTVNADINLPLTTTVRRGVDWYEEGSTALHIACSRRHHDIVQALLKSGAAPDIVNRGAAEQSPLHVAAEHGELRLFVCDDLFR